MGERGPLPQNLAQRWQAGVGLRDGQKGRKPTTPRMPADLSEAEQAIWRQYVPKLAKLGVLRDVDALALRDFTRCVVRLEEAEADIAERGLLVPGERGLVKNPSCQASREYRTALARWSQRFGLTPGDRVRLGEDLTIADASPKPERAESSLAPERRQPDTDDPRNLLRVIS